MTVGCPVNVSEGRRGAVVAELARAARPVLLDVHTDPDHHRCVLWLAGGPFEVTEAASRLEEAALRLVDLSLHQGVHPRLGAVDVVPFVALDDGGAARRSVAGLARDHGAALAERLRVPVFLYGDADPAGRSLPALRREAFVRRLPDLGPPEPHPTFGAVAVGARPPLVALNCELTVADDRLARAIAGAVRESGGGLPGVRALGFVLASRGTAQVSMNLTDLERTGVEAACGAVRRLAQDAGADVGRVELVGLLPAAELARSSEEFLHWSGLSDDLTVEARLERRLTNPGTPTGHPGP